jgi:plastocyanin
MSRIAVVVFSLFCAAPAFAQTPTISLALGDHQFVPAEVTAPAGAKVKLIVKNEQKVNAEFESSSLHREKVVAAGGTITVVVGPLKAGNYEFFDDFHPATRGHLVVK